MTDWERKEVQTRRSTTGILILTREITTIIYLWIIDTSKNIPWKALRFSMVLVNYSFLEFQNSPKSTSVTNFKTHQQQMKQINIDVSDSSQSVNKTVESASNNE